MLQAADLPSDQASIWVGPESRNDCGTFLCQQCRSCPDRLLAYAAKLPGDLARIWSDPERRDDFRAPLCRKPTASPRGTAGRKVDAFSLGYPPNACIGHAADAPRNLACVRVGLERCDDRCTFFGGQPDWAFPASTL